MSRLKYENVNRYTKIKHFTKLHPNLYLKITPADIFTCKVELHQWRSQKAEKAAHIKRRLLDQAMFLFNCVPFQN